MTLEVLPAAAATEVTMVHEVAAATMVPKVEAPTMIPEVHAPMTVPKVKALTNDAGGTGTNQQHWRYCQWQQQWGNDDVRG